jgi:hypothetical protein
MSEPKRPFVQTRCPGSAIFKNQCACYEKVADVLP